MGTARKYIDFKLFLTRAGDSQGQYQVSLLPTPEVGESITPVPFTTSEGAYIENLRDLQNRTINNEYLQQVGKQLADWLLPTGTIRDLFGRALALAGNAGGVRLRLIIANHALKMIPWEYVYNPFARTDDFFGYLALDPRISIVRHGPLDMPQPTVFEANNQINELRMFTSSASPTNASPIAVNKELKKINYALERTRAMGRVRIRPKFSANTQWKEVTDELDRPGKYQIFHFAGHGVVQKAENNITLDDIDLGKLLFAGEDNEGEFVSAGSFADAMRRANIWLVTLGACETGEMSGRSPWHTVAGALIERNIPVVVSMQYEIGDHAAVIFGSEFYGKLKAGLSLDEAMSWCRQAMAAKMLEGNGHVNDMEFGIPVLYTRLIDCVMVPYKDPAEEVRQQMQEKVDTVIRLNQKLNNLGAGGENLGIGTIDLSDVGPSTKNTKIKAKQDVKNIDGINTGIDEIKF